MKREEKLIMGSVFVAIAGVSAISMFLYPQFAPPFEIESRMTSDSAGYLVLDSSEVERFPLIGNVIEAHHNPGSDSHATFKNGVLHYAVFNGTTLCETEVFLFNKLLENQTVTIVIAYPDEPMLWGLAYDRNDGNGLQFYTWQASTRVYDC